MKKRFQIDNPDRYKSFEKSVFLQIFCRTICSLFIFYIILTIWQYEIDVKKTLLKPITHLIAIEEPFEKPNLKYELYSSWGKYQNGLNVYGIEWQDNYVLCDFIFRNNSVISEVENVKLEFEFPIVFVACKEIEKEGIDNVVISDPEHYSYKGKRDTIVDMPKCRTNSFTINISKAHPYSHIHFKIFLKKLEMELQHSNNLHAYFTIKYHFAGKDGKREAKRIIHPINYGLRKENYSIDTSKTFTDKEIEEGLLHEGIIEQIEPARLP